VPGYEANRPVRCVSWGDAARSANWLTNGQPTGPQGPTTTEDGSYDLSYTYNYYGHAREWALLGVGREVQPGSQRYYIPTEDEWYKAAYHKNDGPTGNYWDYPTGTDNVPSNAWVTPDPGNNANFYSGRHTIGEPYYCTPVGTFENSESPYGTFDQGGNVWEWNEAIVYGRYYGVRGGSYNYYDMGESILRAACRQAWDPGYEGGDTGFRIAAVPEPVSLVMLLLGLQTVLSQRRFRCRQ
jgi:formylglycine-generating enzyme required for sulfatase activity